MNLKPLKIVPTLCILGCGTREYAVNSGPSQQNPPPAPPPPASRVWVEESGPAEYRLMLNGEPFRIRGAGGKGNLSLLAQIGGNNIRTWGINEETQALLDEAHDLGITVTLGIWLGHERHGFDYQDPEQLRQQRERVKDAVRRFRDHPALLIWGLGNEMEAFDGHGDREDIWREVNFLAGMVKELDPNHPVMSVVANINQYKIRAIREFAPDLDILGVNVYADAGAVGGHLRRYGWTKPYVVTEFGPPGPWEVEKTAWGAPIEPSSRRMASFYYSAYTQIMEDRAMCLGSCVFRWGHKQETTSTWFGMLLPTGETTPRMDAMAKAWSGKWPVNRAPMLRETHIAIFNQSVLPGETFDVSVSYEDPEGKDIRYEWQLFHESADRRIGGDQESPPLEVQGALTAGMKPGQAMLTAPETPGAYRLFVTARDGHGAGSADNWPFIVQDTR